MNKKHFLFLSFFILLSSNSYSKTNFYQVTGTVSSVEVLKTYSEQRVPRNQKTCSIQRVPVNQNAQKFGADNFIGALIGGAIGNQLGRNEKAEANQNYVEKEVCRINKVMQTETIEQVRGYKLNIEVDGDIISFTSNRSYNPGDLITLTKKISYSLN